MSRQRAAALIVGIARLLTSGHDGVLGDAVPFHERHIDHFLDPFGCQDLPVQPELIVADGRPAQRCMGDGHRFLGRPLRCLDMPDLFCGFHDTAFIKGLAFRLELIT